jgi:dTDP-4-dehydrorhamnose reductase
MTTWLVTGVTGTLGGNAAIHLRGHVDVVGLARDGRALPWCPSVIAGDLLDPDSLRRAVDAVQPDVILHCAALADHGACERDPEIAEAVNVVGSEVLASTGSGRFVLISTDAVFSGDSGDYQETDPVSPTTVYGRTKVEAEQRVLATDAALVVRTNFFGWSPSGTRSILEFFVRELSQGNRVPGFTNYTVTSTFVGDLLPRIQGLVEGGHSGIVHVASSDAQSKYEFGCLVADVFGFDAGLIEPSLSPIANRDLSLNCDRVESLLGQSVPTQRAGIERARQEGSPF